jgi:DNA-directed RNA polymerase subunit RPC12/RpoP
MEKAQLPITCPVCGRKNEFPVEILFEGSTIVCPLCGLKLVLHGHMWEEIQADLEKLKKRT